MNKLIYYLDKKKSKKKIEQKKREQTNIDDNWTAKLYDVQRTLQNLTFVKIEFKHLIKKKERKAERTIAEKWRFKLRNK